MRGIVDHPSDAGGALGAPGVRSERQRPSAGPESSQRPARSSTEASADSIGSQENWRRVPVGFGYKSKQAIKIKQLKSCTTKKAAKKDFSGGF